MDPNFFRRGIPILALALAGSLVSCGRKKGPDGPAVKIDPELSRNRTSEMVGPVFRSQTASPIHWQPWNASTVAHAKDAHRLLLAVVVMPQQSGFLEVLARIEQDRTLVNAMNSNYVPVLVDGDSCREIGLLAAPLCAEIKQPLEMPLFLWMTHELNPVAWMPVSVNRLDEVGRIFNQSHQMVSRMWRDDPDYVMKNSRLDNESRRARMTGDNPAASEKPVDDAVGGARQLISLYDPFSRSIDETGGLFPSGVLDVVSAAGSLPGISPTLRARGMEMTEDLMEDLLPSAMFDPLEGGVFSGRMTQSWSLPSFTWNCPDQGRVAALLFRIHQISGDAMALDRAKKLITFAENRFLREDGLFVYGVNGGAPPAKWLWKTEEVEKALPPEDAKWWIAATGMTSLGNLPSEVDPGRTFFRGNSLALPKHLEAVAAKFNIPAEEFGKRFEASRLKLLEIRNGKFGEREPDMVPHATANFRMISAYSSAYAATGDPVYREKAVALLAKARSAFQRDGELVLFAAKDSRGVPDARAFVYALAMQASLDVADITSDDAPLGWVGELAEIAGKLFKSGGTILETPAGSRLIDLPVSDRRRTFDDTTGGVFAICEARLAPSGHPAAALVGELAAPIPAAAAQAPILYSDVILAALIKYKAKTVLRGPNLSPEMKSAVERLPLLLVPRGGAKVSDGIPEGSVRVILPDGSGKLISNPSDLEKEILLYEKTP